MPEPAKSKDKRLNPMKLQKLQDRAGELEAAVARLEGEIAQAEAALADFRSVEETVRQNEQLGKLRGDLERTMREWEEVSETIEAGS